MNLVPLGIGAAGLLLLLSARKSRGAIPPPPELHELTITSSGLPNNPPPELYPALARLAHVIEVMRAELGTVQILSAYRSPEVNEKVGGVPTSLHLEGRALDFRLGNPTATRELWNLWVSDPARVRGFLQEAILYEGISPRIHMGLATPGESPQIYFGHKDSLGKG